MVNGLEILKLNKTFIAIIKTKFNNYQSVANVLKKSKIDYKITNNKDIISNSNGIIFPGVGSFDKTVQELKKLNIYDFLKKQIEFKRKPFLGICLGMQLLFTNSEEGSELEGFNLIKGKIVKLNIKNYPLPNIGWLKIKQIKKSKMLKHIDDNSSFYFNHSYCAEIYDTNCVILKTKYERDFVSMIEKENMIGLQFHPEKSQKVGEFFFKNFYQEFCLNFNNND